MHQLLSYIKFILKSSNQHGVHSPFVYNLITKCFYDRSKYEAYTDIVSYRSALLKNTEVIPITDFGSGSKVFKTNKRSIATIASKAGISKKRGELLAKTVDYFEPQRILEIGSSLGISTAYMASGAPKANITTLEGCPAIAGIAKEIFKKFNFPNIEVVVGQFEDTLDTVIKDQTFDLIFFDGNHQKKPTISYFEKCLKASHENSVFIFDDIHWTPSMEAAWEYIRKHEEVTLSADTYKWGLVFFKKGKIKEHFTLRI